MALITSGCAPSSAGLDSSPLARPLTATERALASRRGTGPLSLNYKTGSGHLNNGTYKALSSQVCFRFEWRTYPRSHSET